MSVNSDLGTQVFDAIRKVVGTGAVALHEPSFQGNEWLYLKECLESTFVSSVGRFVDRFEADLAAYTGSRHVVAVVNGTAALHIALMLADVRQGDEVLMPALTFVATANAVRYCGATPHFVDSDLRTLGVAVEPLREYLNHFTEQRGGWCVNRRTGRVIRALVPMHTFGHPADIDGLISLAQDFNLALVEDAAESLGSTYHGRHTGTFGLVGALSFNGNKIITTGGGGAILTQNKELARRAKHLTTTAKLPHRWAFEHDEVGYNYRLPNLNASLGCAQLEQLPDFLAAKRRLYEAYRVVFSEMTNIQVIAEPEGCRSNYWLQTLLLDESIEDLRDVLLRVTNDSGVMTRPVWTLMHHLRPFVDCPRARLPVAESLEGRVINLPSSALL